MRHHAYVSIDEDNMYTILTVMKGNVRLRQSGVTYEQAALRLTGILAHFSQPGEVTTRLRNLDQCPEEEAREIIKNELEHSGINYAPAQYFAEIIRPEGRLLGWRFKRTNFIWEVTGPGLPPQYADLLYANLKDEVKFMNRTDEHVLVEDDKSPYELYHGFAIPKMYAHTQRGLLEIARALKRCFNEAKIN